MAVCSKCGNETEHLYNDMCISCLSIQAGKEERHKLDSENDLGGLQLNTPIGEDCMSIFRVGQGNFGKSGIPAGARGHKQIAAQEVKNTNTSMPDTEEQQEEIKVMRMLDFGMIQIVYRVKGETRFAGTAELSKIDGSLYGLTGNNIWYFSRLFVPAQIRHHGAANRLLKELVKVLEEDKITLICEVNAYGDLDTDQLESLYRKFGFKDTPAGFLLYTPKG